MLSRLSLILVLFAVMPAAAQDQLFADLGDCTLESGAVLKECRVGYRTLGKLDDDRSNAILIPSWYGGNS